jgi:hypothetical protein
VTEQRLKSDVGAKRLTPTLRYLPFSTSFVSYNTTANVNSTDFGFI